MDIHIYDNRLMISDSKDDRDTYKIVYTKKKSKPVVQQENDTEEKTGDK